MVRTVGICHGCCIMLHDGSAADWRDEALEDRREADHCPRAFGCCFQFEKRGVELFFARCCDRFVKSLEEAGPDFE